MNQQNPHADLYPTPSEGEIARENTPPPKTPETKPKGSSWKIILIILGGCLILIVIIVALLGGMIFAGLNGAKGKAVDTRIRADLATIRTEAEMWYSDHDTYAGFTADPQIASGITEKGSELIVQGLSDKTFVIYAKLPTAKKLYCLDATGLGVEVDNISAGQTTCK